MENKIKFEGQTDGHSDSYIPPKLCLRGYKNSVTISLNAL